MSVESDRRIAQCRPAIGSLRKWASAPISIAFASIVTGLACSLYVESDRKQCSRNDECAGRHGLSSLAVCSNAACSEPPVVVDSGAGDALAADPVWGCLGNVPQPPASDPSSPVEYRAAFINVLNRQRLADVPVEACASTDPECTAPVAGSRATTDAEGIVAVPVHSGFRGYLELSAPPTLPDLVPSLLYVLPVPEKGRPPEGTPEVWGLITKSSFQFLAASSSREIKPGLGHVFFHVGDCRGKPAANVSVTAAPLAQGSFIYYTDDVGTPGLLESTTALGIGGFVNLPVGIVSLTYTRLEGGRVGSMDVIVRPDTITYVWALPTP